MAFFGRPAPAIPSEETRLAGGPLPARRVSSDGMPGRVSPDGMGPPSFLLPYSPSFLLRSCSVALSGQSKDLEFSCSVALSGQSKDRIGDVASLSSPLRAKKSNHDIHKYHHPITHHSPMTTPASLHEHDYLPLPPQSMPNGQILRS